MLGQIEKYKSNGHFFIMPKSELSVVCNAPKNSVGVFLVYALKNGKIDLIYVGSGGKIKQNGTIKGREEGIFDSIVNRHQVVRPKNKTWNQKIDAENIEALDVYWYETMNKNHCDIPSAVEGKVLQDFYSIYGVLPRWNIEF